MIIIFSLLSIAGWLCGAIIFEAGYQTLKNTGCMSMHKSQACHIWWVVLGGLSLASLPATFLVNLPLILVIGMSHADLAKQKEGIISSVEILKNIPVALRQVIGGIKPFLK